MKTLMYGFVAALGFSATNAAADQIVIVDGESYFLSHLTENCQSITGDPAAQIACFNALSQLLENQTEVAPIDAEAIAQSFDAFRTLAEVRDQDSGLLISGADCKLHVLYYGNYFHISRRNISTIDLMSVQFDAAQLPAGSLTPVGGGPLPLMQGTVSGNTTAAVRGAIELDSARDGFDAKAPDMTLDVYASEVVAQLPAQEVSSFQFMLVHPQRAAASAEIQTAFDAFVTACNG